jgi:hypothetical protein
MRIQSAYIGVWACLALSCGVAGAADPEMPILLMFGNDAPQGRWRLEVLESSDAEALAAARQAGSMSVCMNAATEMGKRESQPSTSEQCTTKLLQNTRTVAQIETICPPRQRKTVMKMTRQSASTILMEWTESGGDANSTRTKALYHYEGPCKTTDSTLSFDKNSEACAEMRKSLAETNPAEACSGMEPQYKEQCLRQIEQSLASIKNMCQ